MTGIIYTVSLDGYAKGVTAAVIIMSAGLGLWSIRGLLRGKGDRLTMLLHGFVIVVLAATLLVSYSYHPQKYELGNFDLVIDRPAGNIVIPVKDILEIRKVTDAEMEGTVRTFGVGGLFGYFGSYHNQHLGSMQWYATRRKNLILIRTTQGNAYILSPDDDGFKDRIVMKMHDLGV